MLSTGEKVTVAADDVRVSGDADCIRHVPTATNPSVLSEAHSLVDTLLDRQRHLWTQGKRISIEDLMQGTSFPDPREVELDLVYNEVVILEELGENPSLDGYLERYPHLEEDLKLHFEIHRLLNDQLLADHQEPALETGNNGSEDSWPETRVRAREPKLSLSDYEIDRPIGQGGMAVVYKARHRRLNRDVALKMFQPGRLPTSREILRFQTEAEAIARLTHPNIIQIFEIGQSGGLPFLALELAEQGTLAQKLQQFSYTPRAAAEFIETLARAVHHAHTQQVIHRDLKPANVLFAKDGTPKVTDFGLAKVLLNEAELPRDATRTGEPIGTPRYMAPEQAAGQQDQIGPLTDVYALGTLLYECLTGQAPFVASSVVDTLQKIRFDEPLSPRRLEPSIPRDLDTICLHCLQKEPSRRYASADALADDLRRFLKGEPIQARPTPTWERAWKWCRRRPAHAALIGVGVLLTFGGVSAAFVTTRLEQQRIGKLRNQVADLLIEGRQALERDETDLAYERFRSAWMTVQAESALSDHRPGVAGWFDHSRNAVNKQLWKQRIPPREYDQRRDEALLQSLLLVGLQPSDAVPAAREAIHDALEFTLPDDPAWQTEREQLILVEADLVAQKSGPTQALQLLDSQHEFSSRLFHERRAAYLQRLGRSADELQARERAAQFPPAKDAALFLNGIYHLRQREFRLALNEFEQVLDSNPEHFMARLLQSICFLNLQRPAEAKVALTACVAQRPGFAWSYLYRSLAHQATGDLKLAAADMERALDRNPTEP
ncbi:MAG: protein kinase family protein, partial [Planctomycetaceae bacterium]|nr:protein kinase family protein [Planctomycetaceae bacterium]